VQRFLGLALYALLTAIWLGCEPSDGLVSISGTIKVDGQPAEKGAITFDPVDGKAQTGGGQISGGSYTARVATGKMKVKITVPKVIGKRKAYDTPDSPEIPQYGESLPAKYNTATELTRDITKADKIDFDLSTKP